MSALLRSRATLVAVYGGGGDRDCGKELAKEPSAKGVRNVVLVRGGAKALSAGGPR